jgi:hypothetical protein
MMIKKRGTIKGVVDHDYECWLNEIAPGAGAGHT